MIDRMRNGSGSDQTRKISLRVLLRITAMDVCCGPPPDRF
jgi:hypothetical protein